LEFQRKWIWGNWELFKFGEIEFFETYRKENRCVEVLMFGMMIS
jgi:hypothetical protein